MGRKGKMVCKGKKLPNITFTPPPISQQFDPSKLKRVHTPPSPRSLMADPTTVSAILYLFTINMLSSGHS